MTFNKNILGVPYPIAGPLITTSIWAEQGRSTKDFVEKP
jgi:hypothetical protein